MTDRPDENTRRMFVPHPGARIGAYTLREPLGAGGMGEVYLAEDTSLGRTAALKFLPLHFAGDDEFRRRFLREARAAAALSHPAIVHVYEVGEHEGRPFIAMEHVDGALLKEIIPPTGMSAVSALRLILPLADALAEAHARGIIHRDLKPSNIMVDRGGRPRLLDFGLAAVAGGERMTRSGSTLGTVGYMAPEQIRGQDPDPRSDLFSLGVILQELLTGRAPFRRDNEAASLEAVLNARPEPLAARRTDATPELQAIVTRLLAKDPGARYPGAGELTADLNAELRRLEGSSTTSVAPPVATPRRTARLLIPALAVVALVAALLIWRPWSGRDGATETAEAAANRLVVLYFENVAQPDDPGRLGEILSNLLITDFSNAQTMQVVSSQRLYDILKNLDHEGEKRIPPEIATRVAREASARWMLSGSILQAEPNLVLSAELVETRTGDIVASTRLAGQPGETVFSVAEKLSAGLRRDLGMAAPEPDGGAGEVSPGRAEAYRLYLEGIEDTNKYFRPEAEAKLLQAVALDSTFAPAWLRLATTAGEDQAKRREYAFHARRHQDQLDWRDRLMVDAELRRADNDTDGAVALLRRIVERDPEDKEVWFSLGQAWRTSGRTAEAINAFERVVAIDPAFKMGHKLLAYVYQQQGDLEKSQRSLDEYIRLAPGEPNPWDSAGDLYALRGDLPRSVEAFRRALAIRPDFGVSRVKLASMLVCLGKLDEAERELTTLAASESPADRRDAAYYRVFALEWQGKFREAAEAMVRMTSDPLFKDDEPLADTAEALFLAGRREDARRFADRAAAALPPDYWKLDILARVFAWLGEVDRAAAISDSIAARVGTAPGLPQSAIWSSRSNVAFARGDSAQGVYAAERLHEAFVDFYSFVVLGHAYLVTGQPELALPLLEKAVVRYDEARGVPPDGVLVNYELGRAREATGDAKGAMEAYRTFLDIWKNGDPGLPGVDDAKRRLARLEAGT